MNKVILIGNLTRDPELSVTPSGVSVCRLSIAVNRKYKDAGGEAATDYFNIVAWRQLGETVHSYQRKGNKIGVVGELQTRSYEDRDGVKRHVTEIVASEIDFLTPKGDTDVQRKSADLLPIEDDSLPF